MGKLQIPKNISLVFFLFLISHFSFLTYTYASDLEKEISNNPPFTKGEMRGFSEEIKAIEVEGLSRIKDDELINMICLRVGDTVDREALKKGIKRAFKKGIFQDIKVISEPYEGGLKLRYIIEETPFVRKINIIGNELIPTRKIKEAFIFKEGKYFKEGYIDQAGDSLRDFYSKRGFPDAEIKISTEKHRTGNSIDINITIREGEPLIIKNIKVPSDAGGRMQISEGDILDAGRMEKNIKKLREYYKEKGYLKPVIGPYEFEDGELVIPVSPGYKLEVVFHGNSVFSRKELLKTVPFFEGEEMNNDLLQEAANRIKRLYQGRGYYYVQAAGGLEKEEDIIKTVFFIFEGEKVLLEKIKFEGLAIPADTVKAVIPLKENKIFDENLLGDCEEAIIRFYNALGYIYAEVTGVRKDFLGDGDRLNLIFTVKEGPQVKIEEIVISGNKAFDSSELIKNLPIKKGDAFNDIDIGDARYKILAIYDKLGYIDAEVDINSTVDADKATVTFEITENLPRVFGKIVIRGNEQTKSKIIRRELVIKESEPYTHEAIYKTRQRLYKLGLFNDISIVPLESGYIADATGESKVITQDVLVDLGEGNPGAVEIGLGYGDYEQMRGFLDISYRNLGGYNRHIGLRTELSSIKKKFILNFKEPWLFNKPELPLNVFLTKEDVRAVNLDTKDVMYKIDRLSLLAGIDRELTEHLRAGLHYEYSIVETSDVKPGLILSREDAGTLGIGSLSPSLFYDTRDNPFNPTSGSLNGIVLKLASKFLLSETEFIKAALQSSWYLQLKKGFVFAFSIRGGVSHGFGDFVELPIIERFFLGGRTTVRGYSQDTLGPKGEGNNPTGGNVFALANMELRTSLGKGFGIVTFLDSGNVWTKLDNVEPELRYTAGLGLRYDTPVGPIRVDYGHKLNKEEGDSAGEIHFSLGHAF